jgi:isoaspartyl peptidase/L-asparaginase-like protein (Ntn-hydrolase superfamily)
VYCSAPPSEQTALLCVLILLQQQHPGRVGDAPVVGAGLYCDDAVGGAVATGDGEEILRTCLCFHVVELMRSGHSPKQACRIGIDRLQAIVAATAERQLRSSSEQQPQQQQQMHAKLTVAVLALSKDGAVGAASTLGPHNEHRGRPAFPFALWRGSGADATGRIVEETDDV